MAKADPFFFTDSSEHDAWLNQVIEDILEPGLPIIDAHHHLWLRNSPPYLALEYFEDISVLLSSSRLFSVLFGSSRFFSVLLGLVADSI